MKIVLLTLVALQGTHAAVLLMHKDVVNAKHAGRRLNSLVIKAPNAPGPLPEPAPPAAAEPASTVVPAAKTQPVKPSTKIVSHMKEPGEGYQRGSPLYEKQQGRNSILDAWVFEGMTAGGKQPSHTHLFWSASVYAIFVLTFAALYKKSLVQPLQARAQGENPMELPPATHCGFAYSCFDYKNFATDWHICLWSLCCPIVQWAGTASKSVTPFMNFWAAVGLMLFLVVLSPFTYGLTGLVVLALFLTRRRQLRRVYNHSQGHWLQDIALVFCCNSFLCCQLVQEAREVEYTSPQQLEAAKSLPLLYDIPTAGQFDKQYFADTGSAPKQQGPLAGEPTRSSSNSGPPMMIM